MTKTFPTLYKLSSKGKLLVWTISVTGNEITVEHGQLGGKIQSNTETIANGKNIGKANETTPEQQADSEAGSEWEKQVSRKGYTPDKARAEAGENEQEGSISPMLAQKYSERRKYIQYPRVSGQKKLDGIRVEAHFDGTKTDLFSRERKPIVGVPHFAEAVTAFCLANGIKSCDLDGEAYNHEYKDKFGQITSFVKKLKPGHEIVQYHIYDCPALDGPKGWHKKSATFETRWLNLTNHFVGAEHPLILVETVPVPDHEEAVRLHFEARAEGYEGYMLRNNDGPYADGARSNDLQKVKEFDEDEFEILGLRTGRGKFEGVPVFNCRAKNGKEFECNPPGSIEDRKKWAIDPDPQFNAVGKLLTVQYFGLTDKEQVPRFPVGKAIRDYE